MRREIEHHGTAFAQRTSEKEPVRSAAAMREELAEVLAERDELVLRICPQIEMQYMVRLGAREYEAQRQRYRLRVLQCREAMLMQEADGTAEGKEAKIDRQLAQRFALERQALEAQGKRVRAALERNRQKVLSEDEQAAVQKVYRQILRQLHPLLHPKQTKGQQQMFANAQDAYERSDLETLYMIYETLKEGCFAMEEDTANSREPEEQRLSMQLQSVRAEIVAIRQRKPYRLSALLVREGYVDERNKVLKAEIEDCVKAIRDCQSRMHHYRGETKEEE